MKTTESTLEAIEAIEKAADALMRLGDTPNAISLYSLALKIRSEIGAYNDVT